MMAYCGHKDGYSLNTGLSECDGHMYGSNCTGICGTCLDFEQCHHINGTCLEGCDRGFHGSSCIEECPNGSYGYNCQQNCSTHCQVSGICNRKTGHCHCQVGWKPEKCDSPCDDHMYGINCTEKCGSCLNFEQCHHINGTCMKGCDRGFHGSSCIEVCNNNTYGSNCSLSCGNCLYVYGEQCHHVTGLCPRGCVNGFQGDFCDEENDQSLSSSETRCQLAAPLYSFVSLFCVSVLIIVCLVLRVFRHHLPKCQHKQGNENTGNLSSSKISNIMYTGDKCAYDEVGEVTKNQDYDELQ